MSTRSVLKVVQTVRTLEGEGFVVRRPFPVPGLMQFDPFLLLDEVGPVTVLPGEAKGAPDHPHRGFETVSYILEGRHEHRDSEGHAGELGPGDVQWMTAGAGVVHSETPTREFARTGGRMHAFQVWVNLPRRDKMMPPRYQDIPSERIPVASTPDGKVRVKVIAGESLGARAVIDTRTPIQYLHFTLEPGSRFEQPVPRDHNAFAYVFGGEGSFGPEGTRAVDGLGGDGEHRGRAPPTPAPHGSAPEGADGALWAVRDEHRGGALPGLRGLPERAYGPDPSLTGATACRAAPGRRWSAW